MPIPATLSEAPAALKSAYVSSEEVNANQPNDNLCPNLEALKAGPPETKA